MSFSFTLIALSGLLLINVMTFRVYWMDKDAARGQSQRVRETTLLWLAFLGGSPGAVCAQKLLRHKTRKEPFRSRLEAIVFCHIILVLALIFVPTDIYVQAEAALRSRH